MNAAFSLGALLAVLMLAQSILGIVLHDQYRDVEWIRATWFGNDCVTLVVAVPLLVIGHVSAARGSVRGLLLWLGLLGYGVYNYAFYLFGAALNAFFLLYALTVVLAVVTLILALSHVDVAWVIASVRSTLPIRLVGGSLVFVGTGLAAVWIAMWAGYVFAGRPTPVEPETFKLVAALDLSLIVPALTIGGILLWHRMPWGYIIAPIASIQGALYLVVLSVNSIVAIRRGLVTPPGELPIWGLLAVFTAAIAFVLLANVRRLDQTHVL